MIFSFYEYGPKQRSSILFYGPKCYCTNIILIEPFWQNMTFLREEKKLLRADDLRANAQSPSMNT